MKFGDDAPERSWPTSRILVKGVCNNCNNGWMSRLESATIPFLSPLVVTDSGPLTALGALQIATWAVKTAMAFDCTKPESDRFHARSDYETFGMTQVPPSGTLVFLGRFETQGFPYGPLYASAARATKVVDAATNLYGFSTVLALGYVVFNIIRIRGDRDLPIRKFDANRVPGDEGLSRIWPLPASTTSVQWPPRDSFRTEQDLDALTWRLACGPSSI